MIFSGSSPAGVRATRSGGAADRGVVPVPVASRRPARATPARAAAERSASVEAHSGPAMPRSMAPRRHAASSAARGRGDACVSDMAGARHGTTARRANRVQGRQPQGVGHSDDRRGSAANSRSGPRRGPSSWGARRPNLEGAGDRRLTAAVREAGVAVRTVGVQSAKTPSSGRTRCPRRSRGKAGRVNGTTKSTPAAALHAKLADSSGRDRSGIASRVFHVKPASAGGEARVFLAAESVAPSGDADFVRQGTGGRSGGGSSAATDRLGRRPLFHVKRRAFRREVGCLFLKMERRML